MFIQDSFRSTNNENKIITYTWMPEDEPKGVVQIVHGMQEHMGRYNEFAEYLNYHGFIVAGHDHIGHGKTALEYGVFGYFGEKKGAKYLVNDSRKHTRILKTKHPDLPLYLLGHSMGSFITRVQVIKDSDLLNGYICMGSSDINRAALYIRAVAQLNSKIEGPKKVSLGISNAMDKVVFNKNLGKDEATDSWISHDEEIVEVYKNDPLTRFYFTNAGYSDLMDLTMAATLDRWYHEYDPLLPIFLMSGKEDPVGNMGKGIERVHKKLEIITQGVNVECKIYENMRHEILNEIDRQEVYADILNWINKWNSYYEVNQNE